jgi:hypothetical protein
VGVDYGSGSHACGASSGSGGCAVTDGL